MIGTLLLGYGAGLLSTLNPCVLPLVPLVLASALQTGRAGPAALMAGMVAGFTILGVAVASVGFSLGFDPLVLRQVAAVLFILIGLVLVSSTLQARLATAAAPLSDGTNVLLAKAAPDGLWGQGLIGALLGAVWAPCGGPTFAAAVGLAATGESLSAAGAIFFVYGLGAASVLAVFAYGTRALAGGGRDSLASVAKWGRPVLAAVLLAVGLAVLTGLDKRAEAAALDLMPDWLLTLTTSL